MLRRRANHRSYWRFWSMFLAVSSVWLIFGGLRSSAQTLLVFDQPTDAPSSNTAPGQTPPVRHQVLEQVQQVTSRAMDLPAKLKQSGIRAAEQNPFFVATNYIAQTGSTASGVPANGFYAGLGPSYNTVNFGTQDVFAVGTSQTLQGGRVVSQGSAAGPGSVNMPSQSTFAPWFQAGYFRHFGDTKGLWGLRLSYSYLNLTSTVDNVVIPQAGSFTDFATGTTTPFIGNAVAKSYQTTLVHQFALLPFVGQSLEKGFVYAGGGPTWSRTRTTITSLVGFADLHGDHTDVSGPPVDFTASGWVLGGAGVVGGTWFLNPSWFLDFSYVYSQTKKQTFNYSATYTNPSTPFGTLIGSLVGNSAGRVISQGIAITIIRAF